MRSDEIFFANAEELTSSWSSTCGFLVAEKLHIIPAEFCKLSPLFTVVI